MVASTKTRNRARRRILDLPVPASRKTESIRLRVSPEEKRRLRADAKRLGYSMSEFLLAVYRKARREIVGGGR